MKCIFCGANTHGPWNYCDATCEQDHQTELAAQEVLGDEPESGGETTTYDTLIDDDEQDILDNMRRAQEAAEDDAEYAYENRPAFTEISDAF